MYKSITYIFFTIFAISINAQIQQQEQSSDLIRKNKVKRIDIYTQSSKQEFKHIKTETYNSTGFNTSDVIYKKSEDTVTYAYFYKADTFLNGRHTISSKYGLISKTLIDFDHNRNIINENEVNKFNYVNWFIKFDYDKKNRIAQTTVTLRNAKSILMKENNLWKYEYDFMTKNDSLTGKRKPQNKVIQKFKIDYVFNNSIQKKKFSMPNKSIITFLYDKSGNNTSQIKKEYGKDFKIIEIIYENKLPIKFINYFDKEVEILSLEGKLTVFANDVLTTNLFYGLNGLIDYKTQYYNNTFIAKQTYKYELNSIKYN